VQQVEGLAGKTLTGCIRAKRGLGFFQETAIDNRLQLLGTARDSMKTSATRHYVRLLARKRGQEHFPPSTVHTLPTRWRSPPAAKVSDAPLAGIEHQASSICLLPSVVCLLYSYFSPFVADLFLPFRGVNRSLTVAACFVVFSVRSVALSG